MKIALHENKAKRSGATLTEVLMSLLIFSIGIVSVFTLFPVSLLSSIQATKLTNSKILADNATDLIRTNPAILVPPCPLANADEGFWQANHQYSVGDCIRPTLPPGQLFAFPIRVYEASLVPVTPPAMPPMNPVTAAIEPNWPTSGTVRDGDFIWTAVTFAALDNYVVDPMGAALVVDPVGTPDFFGYDGTTNVSGIRRSAGGMTDFNNQVVPFFTQPDSWTVVFEEVPTAITDTASETSVEFDFNVDLSGVVTANHRMSIISLDGKSSLALAVNNPATVIDRSMGTNKVNLENNGASDLPSSMDSASEVSKVRLEIFNPRYSYFITVRKTNPNTQPHLSAVLMFNRSFSTQDEEIYKANFGNSTYSDDSEVDGGLMGGVNSDQLLVSWDGKQKPLLREGNYVFDARNVLWYQIADINLDEANERALITLNHSAEDLTVDTGTAADSVGRAIFMPGIIKVIEL